MKGDKKNQTDEKAHGLGLLHGWLKKAGVGSRTELSDDEKATYDNYYEILTEEPTLEGLVQVLKDEHVRLNDELLEAVKTDDSKKALLISARIENIKLIVGYAEEPDREREALIAHLTSLINQ